MDSQAILDLLVRFVATGQVTDPEKELLKAQYLYEIGAPAGCKTCGSVWSDIQHHFSYKLKQLNLTPVSKLRKYLILGAAFLMLPGSSKVIVNEGEDSDDREVLTDQRAEQILKEFPDYSSLIGINPAWQAAQDAIAEHASDKLSGKASDSDDEEAENAGLDTSKAELEALQAKYDVLEAEHTALKKEHTSLKGQFTRLKNATTGQPIDPAATTNPAPDGNVDPNKTLLTGTADGEPAADGDASEPKGTPAADAAQEAISQAQS